MYVRSVSIKASEQYQTMLTPVKEKISVENFCGKRKRFLHAFTFETQYAALDIV